MDQNRRSKLLFFDIDGTLIDDHGKVPESVMPALRKAAEQGCQLFLNTGRTSCNMDKRIMAYPWDGLITGCGSRVVYRGRTLKETEFSHADSMEITGIAHQHEVPMVYECDTAMYFDPLYADFPVIGHFRKFSDNAGISREISETDEAFRAVKMFGFAEKKETVDLLLADWRAAGYGFEVIDRGQTGWEIIPEGCSKAAGIDLICRETGASLSDCYAFGDSTNDLPMLEHVPNSFAMGNAPEEVKDRCAYVTARPEEDGIAKAVQQIIARV